MDPKKKTEHLKEFEMALTLLETWKEFEMVVMRLGSLTARRRVSM